MKRLGIIVALPDESRSLLGRRARVGAVANLGASIVVAVSGLGAPAAARAARSLADSGVGALLSWGTAGGLDPRLAAGALLVPEAVLDSAGNRYPTMPSWHLRLCRELEGIAALGGGRLLTVGAPLASVAVKRRMFAELAADAVDMESSAIAAVAAERGLPFAVVRSVVDAADEGLPQVVQLALDEYGRLQPRAIAGALLRRPQEIIGMLRVARHFAAAERSLRAVAAHAVDRVFWAPPQRVPEAAAA